MEVAGRIRLRLPMPYRTRQLDVLCRLRAPSVSYDQHLRICPFYLANISGRTVRGTTVPTSRAGDRVSVTWDTRDEHGQSVPNGVYLVRVAQAQAVCKVVVQR